MSQQKTSVCSDESFVVEQFISRLKTDALHSSAVEHPYLRKLENGDFADPLEAFRDFAEQYGLYSSKFASYVSTIIKLLTHEKHKEILLENLHEEQGSTHDVDLPPDVLESVIDQPHSLLFLRFQKALGAGILESSDDVISEPGFIWAREFAKLCSTNQYVGIGAIGFGTELIVSKIYEKILRGIHANTSLTAIEHVFFDLHSECDDEHAEQLLSISRDLAEDAEKRELIEFGANKALELRIQFWDTMLERALLLTTEDQQLNQG